jgi:hypothetical protein
MSPTGANDFAHETDGIQVFRGLFSRQLAKLMSAGLPQRVCPGVQVIRSATVVLPQNLSRATSTPNGESTAGKIWQGSPGLQAECPANGSAPGVVLRVFVG